MFKVLFLHLLINMHILSQIWYWGEYVSLGDWSFVKLYIRHLLSTSSWKGWGLFPCIALPRTTYRRQETFHSASKVRWMTMLSYTDSRWGKSRTRRERNSREVRVKEARATHYMYCHPTIPKMTAIAFSAWWSIGGQEVTDALTNPIGQGMNPNRLHSFFFL